MLEFQSNIVIRSDCHRQAAVSGFTLLEVLLSLAILTFAIAAIFESMGSSALRLAKLLEREAAWLAAQSLLSTIRADTSLELGERSGTTTDGMTWQTLVSAYPSNLPEHTDVRPYQVSITLEWGDSEAERLTLKSIELTGFAR